MKSRIVGLMFLIAGVDACAFGRGPKPEDLPPVAVVQVDNQGFLDMTVFASRSSQRVRLGIAAGNNKTNFNIPQSLITGLTPLRFVADPIGGNRASVSQEITVAPGDTVVLTIPPS